MIREFERAHRCDAGLDVWITEPDVPVVYRSQFREFVIAMSGGDAVVMRYCPLCGRELPKSLRDDWFERIWELGLTGPEDERVPSDMRSDTWWVDGLPGA